jgi:HEAT repeat protein
LNPDREIDANKTAAELFSASFDGDDDDEPAWDAVRALRWRNDDEVFELAAAYAQSGTPKHRARALDVLAQLGAGKPLAERPHFDDSVSIALAHLEDDDPLVTQSAAWALAHLQGDTATSALISARKCADAQVRLAVSVGVASSERPDSISTLMELMEDDDAEVRNWATCGLGIAGGENGPPVRLGTLDSAGIREALRRRLTDPFREVRSEVVWGLARRKEPAALQLLLDRLSSEECIAGDEMTAAEILGLDSNSPLEELRTGLRNLLRT